MKNTATSRFPQSIVRFVMVAAVLLATTAVNANPFAGSKFFVDPHSNARRQANEWRNSRPADAALMQNLAQHSAADWYGDWNSNIYQDVNQRVSQITAEGSLPVLVAYNIPVRDLNSYSGGGAKSPEAYRQWIRDFARGIGSRKAVVILEPDALAQLNHLNPKDQATRLALINDAVDVLTANAGTAVYIDIGNSAWLAADDAASRLKLAGIEKVRGFALNVSNFQTNANSIKYGQAIAAKVGGNKSFVVDTSRNGNGPGLDNTVINPKGVAIGVAPTANTGVAGVDAFLWIKRPGESDGNANGGPRAGMWWAEGALEMLKKAETVGVR